MSWSFYHVAKASEINRKADETIRDESLALPDQVENHIRKNALAIIQTVARVHHADQPLKVEASGSMLQQNEDPAKYSLSLKIETVAAV